MKTELIKQLYEEGKITFEQAMTLASNEEAQIPSPEGGIPSISEKSRKEKFIENLVSDVVDKREEDGELMTFDIDKVVKYMKDDDWTWGGGEVTYDRFEETLRTYLKEVIACTVEDYLSGDWKDSYLDTDVEWPCYRTIQCGGIEVESWYNYEEGIIEAQAKFVIEEAMADASVDLLK